MKRILRTALLLLLCLTLHCCLVPAAHAEEVASGECGANGDNLTWTLDDTGLLTISGEGEMRNFSYNSTDAWRAYLNRIIEAVIMPGVTNVGYSAFNGCTRLTNVTIPEGVKSISGSTFFNCSSLTSVMIPEGVTSIGYRTFFGCSSLASVMIPESVTSIGDHAFSGCSSLTSVTIPESVVSIDGSAFSDCSSLTSITIPESVVSIGNAAFSGCSSLTSVTIPEGITNVSDYAYRNCSSLTDVTIPEGVTSIGDGAFSGCSSLTNVTIPESVVLIGSYAFNNCRKLADVYYGGSEEQWKLIRIESYNNSLKNATMHYGMIPEIYTVSYDANGGTGAPESQTKTEKISLTLSNVRPTHEKANTGSYTVRLNPNDGSQAVFILRAEKTTSFTFCAWNTAKDGSGTDYAPGASYTVDADLALYAQWDSTTVTASVTLPELSHVGASFLGWATSTDAETGITGNYTPTDDVTLYAIWESNTFTVSYNANGGTDAPAAQTKEPGVALTLSAVVPTRANTSAGSCTVTLNANGGSVSPASLSAARTTSYSFKNWNTAADGSGTDYAPGAAYSTDANVTLYAQWESKTATAAVALPTPTRDGYVFKGWATSTDAETGITGSYTPTDDVTLYAIWESNTFTVSYDANGGTDAPAAQTKDSGVALTLSAVVPTRANTSAGSCTVTLNANGGSVSPTSLNAARTTSYSFKNWNTAADGSGTDYAPGAAYSTDANVTLYAQWESEITTAAVALPTPTREDFTFQGWATDSSTETGITGNYTPTDDVTLYAIWESNTFTVSYNANGGTGAPAAQTKEPGVALTLSDIVPTRANTSAGSYTVTLNANGGSMRSTSLNAARTTSYTFKNWNTAADGSGTSYAPGAAYSTDADVTLYAQWNSSTSTAAVKLPTPTRSGYAFKGWGKSSTSTSGVTGSYTPTGDVTLYAIWQSADFILPDSLTTIEAEAFEGGAFRYVQLPEGAIMIGSRAFADCPSLAYIYIPEETGTIAVDAFSGVSGLTILGRSGSYAEFYAQRNGIAFVAVE